MYLPSAFFSCSFRTPGQSAAFVLLRMLAAHVCCMLVGSTDLVGPSVVSLGCTSAGAQGSRTGCLPTGRRIRYRMMTAVAWLTREKLCEIVLLLRSRIDRRRQSMGWLWCEEPWSWSNRDVGLPLGQPRKPEIQHQQKVATTSSLYAKTPSD
jgi:hypothetical protein